MALIEGSIRDGLAMYDDPTNYHPRIRLDHNRRTRAACRNTHIIACATRAGVGVAGVRISTKGSRTLFVYRDQVCVSFKLLDGRLRSRNYPTKQARDFSMQRFPNLDLPPQVTAVVAGYVPDASETSFELFVTCPMGTRNLWEMRFVGPDALEFFRDEAGDADAGADN